MKFTTNIKIDLALIPVFIILVVSGIGIHVTDEVSQHHIWHNWAVAHVIAATLFLILGIYHIIGHWPWFRSMAKTLKKKSRITMILTLVFIFETISGLILLAFTDGGNSHIGLWHWWVGLFMTLFGILHLLKRWKILKTGFSKL